MSTDRQVIRFGIASFAAGTLTLGLAVGVGAADRISPESDQRPAPTILNLPCPAADIARCDLERATNTATGTTVASLRVVVAAGGGVATLNPGRMSPSPR